MKSLIKQGLTLLLFLLITLSLFPSDAFAAAYGECGYGEGKYGTGCTATTGTSDSGSSGDGSSTPSAPSCTALAPSSAPWLYGAIAQDGNSILLYFTDASDPVDSYALEFGTESGNYQWGATNIGGKGLRTYLVQSLLPNKTYYFRVRGGNGCATGAWSNEISAKTKGLISFNQFTFTDSELDPAPLATDDEVVQETSSSCQTYTVQSGDSLWGIAVSELEDGSKFKEIIEQNKETYPSLSTSNSVSVGWELKLNCEGSSQDDKAASEEDAALDSYIVNVNVFGKGQNPVGGATVTIHSDPQEAITDENGTVRFESVEPGEHRVLVAYNGYEGEQSIFLTGDTKEFTLNITLEMKNILMSRLFIAIVGGMAAIIAVLSFFLLRTRFKKV
jgi:hypothetical protein